jgi:hypothetical protein
VQKRNTILIAYHKEIENIERRSGNEEIRNKETYMHRLCESVVFIQASFLNMGARDHAHS